MLLLRKLKKEWSIAVVFALFACYYIIRSLPSASRKRQLQPISSPEGSGPLKPDKWVYNPKKIYPPEWYQVPTTRQDGTCVRKHNLYFLRTHQTGTSSVTNIFYRYGQEHNLNFVMYPLKLNINYPGKMNAHYLESVRPEKGEYNILCQYIRHNKMDVLRMLPDGVIFTTLLRHPLDQFLSVFNNFDIKSAIPNLQVYHNPYREFFRNPDRIAKLSPDNIYHMLQNSMSFDMGLNPIKFKDTDVVDDFIAKVDEDFHLVMILEMLDESLVLLKRLMCWDLKQLIYVKLSMNNEYKTSVDEDIQQKILEWNAIDLRLYNHFKAKLEILVAAQDESFHAEVAALKSLNTAFWKECYTNALPVYNGNKIGFILSEDHKSNTTCKLLATDDVTQTHIIGMKQFKALIPPSDVLMVRNHMQNLKKRNPAMLEWNDVKDVLLPAKQDPGTANEF